MKRINVEKRAHDFIAYLVGRTGVWGCGASPNEAIGNMVSSHYDLFQISVCWHNGSTTANWNDAEAQQ